MPLAHLKIAGRIERRLSTAADLMREALAILDEEGLMTAAVHLQHAIDIADEAPLYLERASAR